jgi:NTE family protein
MRIGLALGGGGTIGEAFHRGVIRAMEDHGLDPRGAHVVVGTSAGSVVAASLRRHAPHRPPPLNARSTGRFLPGRGTLLDLSRRPRQGLNALLLWPALATGRRDIKFMAKGLEEAHGGTWPEAALWVVAVRRRDGRRVIFGKTGEPVTSVGLAVAASCAIPGYFQPVAIDGTAYVDGAMHSPTNADVLAGCDLDLVVISSPMSVDLRSVRPRLDLPFRLRCRQLLRGEIWALHRRRVRVVAIEPDAACLGAMGLNIMSGHRLDEIEAHAYAHASRRLAAVARRYLAEGTEAGNTRGRPGTPPTGQAASA